MNLALTLSVPLTILQSAVFFVKETTTVYKETTCQYLVLPLKMNLERLIFKLSLTPILMYKLHLSVRPGECLPNGPALN